MKSLGSEFCGEEGKRGGQWGIRGLPDGAAAWGTGNPEPRLRDGGNQKRARYSGELIKAPTTALSGTPKFISTVQKLMPVSSPLRCRKVI